MKCLSVFKTNLLFGFYLSTVFVGAQTVDTTKVYALKDVVFSARKTQVEVIPVQALSGTLLSNLGAHSVADALRYFAGVQIKDYGGIGGLKTVNVRSMGSQHVGVFYDGVQIDNPQNGIVDLGRYSLDNMEAIYLYNGQKSSIFQPAKDYSSASSIYMKAKIPVFDNKERNLKLTFKTGAFDLINPSLLWEEKVSDNLSSSFNVEYMNTSGKYRFTHTIKNRIDDRGGYDTTLVRKNGNVQYLRLEHALFGKTKGWDWRNRTYFYYSERGYPGAVVKEIPGVFKHEDWQRDKNFFFQASAKKKLASFYTTQISGKYAYDYIFYESDTLVQKLRNKYMVHNVYLSSANLFELKSFWTVNLSTDVQWQKMNSNLYGFIYPERYSGWAAAATYLDFNTLKIQASLLGTFIHESTREEKKDIQRDWNKLTPTIMAAWQPWRDKEFYVRAFYKDIFRMPTFMEMHMAYMGSLSSFLRPEFSKQHNIGVVYSESINSHVSAQIQLDAYYNRVKDKIVAVPGGVNFRWTMMNLGLVKIRGVDLSLGSTIKLNKDLLIDTRINYTYQKAQDYSPVTVMSDTITYKGQIAYIPWHSGSAIFSTEYKQWNLSYSFIYAGERYTGSANILENYVQSWYTHDLALTRTFSLQGYRFRTTMEVNNLMNQQYAVVNRYPMPGINFKFIVSVTI